VVWPGVRRARDRVLKTFFVQDLAFRPESTMQEALLAELKDIPTVTSDALYKEADYRPFNLGKALGRLRIVPPGTPYESLLFEPDDIVILQESYPCCRARMTRRCSCSTRRAVSAGEGLPESGPLDIEWVLEGEKVWIVQARPFIDGGS
jgi:hypothetical protein